MGETHSYLSLTYAAIDSGDYDPVRRKARLYRIQVESLYDKQCPDYLPAFDRVMRRTWGHMFNMFVMSADKCDAYCAWLFPILEQLEDRVDYKSLDPFQARLFGRVSELLLDVWLETQGYSYQELPLVSPEPVNWWRKGTSFLKAKFLGRKYGASF